MVIVLGRRRGHDVEVVEERRHERAEGRLDDDQGHAREHVLPVLAQLLRPPSASIGDVHGADVVGQGAPELHGADDRARDVGHRDDDARALLGLAEDPRAVDVQLPLGGLVLVMDEPHDGHEDGDETQHDERCGRLRDGDDDGHEGGDHGADRVDREAAAPALGTRAQPVADHARLADREVDEDAHRVERDERVRVAPEADDEQRGQRCRARRCRP